MSRMQLFYVLSVLFMTHRRSRGFAGNRAEEFVKLPKKSEFPDYYELVDTPKALVKQPRLIDESARTDRNRTKRFRTHGRSWVFFRGESARRLRRTATPRWTTSSAWRSLKLT